MSQPHDHDDLEAIARSHDQGTGFTPRLIACRANTLAQVLSTGPVLDLGCADGLLTAHLAGRHGRVVAVDASDVRLERTRARVAGVDTVDVVKARFEDFDPGEERFAGVVMSCILEHLPNPGALLNRARRWLAPGGRVVAIVPNGTSLHRRAGVLMGMLSNLADHGEADHALGHETVFDVDGLATLFESAGYRVAAQGGHLIKPVPNDQMTALAPGLIDAYEELGRQLPELAAEAWVAGENIPPAHAV